MGFPDRIERVIDLPASVDAVWAAVTTEKGLSGWFGQEASIELTPGGRGAMRWPDGFVDDLRVERVEAPTVFGFTWTIHGRPKNDPRRTYVEFTLEPIKSGTRLRLVETGFAQLPEGGYQIAYDEHTIGWDRELADLQQYLSAS